MYVYLQQYICKSITMHFGAVSLKGAGGGLTARGSLQLTTKEISCWFAATVNDNQRSEYLNMADVTRVLF